MSIPSAEAPQRRSSGIWRSRSSSSRPFLYLVTSLLCLGLLAYVYCLFLVPFSFITNNMTWNLLTLLLTVSGLNVLFMPKPDEPLTLLFDGQKRWWMVFSYASMVLVIASPFAAMVLVGFEEALVLILVVILNVAALTILLVLLISAAECLWRHCFRSVRQESG